MPFAQYTFATFAAVLPAALLLVATSGVNVAMAQELGVDAHAEAEFFEELSQRIDREYAGAVDSATHPPLGFDEQRERTSNATGTIFGIPPAAPPIDLPYPITTDLELPFDLDTIDSDQVRGYIAYYCTDGRRQLNLWAHRAGRYRAIIEAEAARQNAPEELIWVAAVESAFTPTVTSHAGAVGIWQFMPRTGRYLGMRIDDDVDDRRDPVVSTAYAIDYLKLLRDEFGSWGLALAAYNAGMGHVSGELRRVSATDIWRLDAYNAVYENARNYAARIFAIATIMKNPEHFGFDGIEEAPPMQWEDVVVDESTSLTRIAERTGTERAIIEALNPQLVGGATPDDEATTVRIPEGTTEVWVRNVSRLPANSSGRYELRFGETLGDVAARFGTSEAVLRVHNGFAARSPSPYQTTIRIPDGLRDSGSSPDNEDTPVVLLPEFSFKRDDQLRVFYRVRPGDTLNEIAEHFETTPDMVAGWNDLSTRATLWSDTYLQIFIPLDFDLEQTVYLNESEVEPVRVGTSEYNDYLRQLRERRESSSTSGSSSSATTYRVRSGDTVGGIARRFGVSTDQIIRWNRLDSSARIRIGQTLRIYR